MQIVVVPALGCKPLVAPSDAWVQSDGDQATVQCNDTDEAWHLTCRGTLWVGTIGNCSDPVLLGNTSVLSRNTLSY